MALSAPGGAAAKADSVPVETVFVAEKLPQPPNGSALAGPGSIVRSR